MRITYILIAVIVSSFIYMFIQERDALLALAGAAENGLEEPLEATDKEAVGIAHNSRAEGDPTPQKKPIPVVAKEFQAEPVKNAVILRGVTEPIRRISVQVETTGQVISDAIRRGAAVREGDLLCSLDPGTRFETLTDMQARHKNAQAQVPVARARIAEADARLKEALINENVAVQLSSDGFASETRVASANAAAYSARASLSSAQAGLEASKANVLAAQSALAQAEKEIQRLKTYAPITGILESDTAEFGAFLSAGNPQSGTCAEIVDISELRVVGYVSERDVNLLKVGSLGRATLSASSREVTGKVSFIAKSADPVTRTFEVEITISNSNEEIRAGETAEIGIQADDVKAHLIPQSSLTLNDDGVLGVRIAQEGRAKFMPIEIIRDTKDGFWVTGLPDLAKIIVIGQEFVLDGVAIEAFDASGARL